jgi:hypothetical protein
VRASGLGRFEQRVAAPAPGAYSPAEVDGLPEPVRRYFAAAVRPGAPLAQAARLRMRGRIRIGRWLPFTARQVLAPRSGFVWAARAGGIITGYDRYVDGAGESDWRIAGLVPVAHADGPDVSRSAAGRAAAEAVWLPTTLLPRSGTRWTAEADDRISAECAVGDVRVQLRFRLDATGRPLSIAFERWGDPGGTGDWGLHPFGGEFSAYTTWGGLTIPSRGDLGWFYGTDCWTGGSFRYRITRFELLTRAATAGTATRRAR